MAKRVLMRAGREATLEPTQEHEHSIDTLSLCVNLYSVHGVYMYM